MQTLEAEKSNAGLNTLPDIVCHRARVTPDGIAYRFFQGAALVPEVLTFRRLWTRAASLAAQLQERGLFGERVLLVCKSQQNFVVAFYACLLAGAVAVPTAPPRRQNLQGRLQLLAHDAQVKVLISDGDEVNGLCVDGQSLDQIDLRAWNSLPDHADRAAAWRAPQIGGADLAFLQYTSGSTGDPKGVMVTHANLMHNCAEIQQGMAFTPASSIFTALPLFHDMGLVGGVLESMFVGCIGNCMSPAEFVQYPERWLQIVSKFRITISGGPNFMYDLAARSIKPEEVAGIDLSSWEVAFCGAEPIRAATMASFTERFAAYGLRPTAFYPCYGMAEATLFITGKAIADLPAVSRLHGNPVVACGATRVDARVKVVDPERLCELPDGATGEVWVSGPSVAAGYWRRPELTAATFHARIDGDDARYLRTGDLGFIEDGQLHLSGRIKDLIILYGKKYAPQDLEEEAERAHSALQRSAGAAFGVSRDGHDRLVLVSELSREWLRRPAEWPDVVKAVRNAITAAHGVTLDEVVFIRPGTLPRTSSGKVRRSQCSIDYLADALATAKAADPT